VGRVERHMRRLWIVLVGVVACGGAAKPVIVEPQTTTTAIAPAETVHGTLLPKTPPPTTDRPREIAGTPIHFEGGDGSSIDKAIVIRGARGEGDGVQAEYWYLAQLYGPKGAGHDVLQQSLLNKNGHAYDALDVHVTAGNLSMTVYFDITDYFGKF